MNHFAQPPRSRLATFVFWVPFGLRLHAGAVPTSPAEQQAEQLQRIVDAINSALQGLVLVLGQAVVVTAHVVIVVALPMATLWLLVKFGVPRIPQSSQQTRLVAVRIVPPADAAYEPARWIAVYKMLYAIARPWWRRTIMGQPWLAFELEAFDGQLIASCAFPRDLQTLVTSALRLAVHHGSRRGPSHVPGPPPAVA